MFVQLSCIIVDSHDANRQEMANFLIGRGVSVASMLSDIEQLPSLLGHGNSPRLVLVNLDPQPEAILQKLSPLIQQHANISFFVMSQVLDASLVMEAMHVGVKEFVALPVNEAKLVASIERIARQQGLSKLAKVINFIPTIGGCGATTIACNVAAGLAKGNKALLLDMDLLRGGVANAFDVRPRYSIADVTDVGTELDKALVDNAVAVHRASGLSILARPEHLEDTHRISREGVARLLGVVSRMFDYILVDSVMSLDPLYTTLMQMADLNVLVMQLNVPSSRNTERFLASMRRLGIDANRTSVVVNRFVKRGYDIDPEEVEKALGLKIAWRVPNDFKNAIAAINYGEPVVLRSPRAELSESIGGLMQVLNGRNENSN